MVSKSVIVALTVVGALVLLLLLAFGILRLAVHLMFHTPTELDKHIVFVYTPRRHQAILRILRHFHTFCLSHGIPYWVWRNTAWQQRCQGIIPFDDDADVAVPLEHIDFIKQNLVSEHPRFAIENHNVPEFKVWDNSESVPAFVDVFGVELDDSIQAYRFTQDARTAFAKQVFYPAEVFPLQTIALHDIEVMCMSSPQNYLARTYSAEWNTQLVVYVGHSWHNQFALNSALQFQKQQLALTDEVREIMNQLAQQTVSLPDSDLDYVGGDIQEQVLPSTS